MSDATARTVAGRAEPARRVRARGHGSLPTALGVVLAVVVAGLGALPAAVPAQAATIDPTAYYQLVNRHSGKALTIEGGSTADAAGLVQRTPDASAAHQQFQLVPSGAGYHRLKARHSGKVADLFEWSPADGARLVQWSDTNGANQQFAVRDVDATWFRLVNRHSGKALDVWEWSTADGARISQYADTGATNQQFRLVRVGSTATPTPAPTTPAPTTPGTPTTPPASYPGPGRVLGDVDVHDPTVVKRPEGGYLLAATAPGLALRTSTDRTTWRAAGTVWPAGAPWTAPYTAADGNLWAPDLTYRDGQYWLYYSASSFGSQRSAIFLATSPSGESGSWTHRGLVIESSTADDHNAIDPNLVVDEAGRWWLSFGSFWSGLKLIRLDPATGLRHGTDREVRPLASRPSAGGALEAPFIVRRGGYYYLWMAFDSCCQGASSTYRVMVGRSTAVTGPYVDRNGTALTRGGGTQVLAGHGSVHGPGHPAVLQDVDGDVLVYHWYDDSGRALLGLNLIGYDAAGWPFVY